MLPLALLSLGWVGLPSAALADAVPDAEPAPVFLGEDRLAESAALAQITPSPAIPKAKPKCPGLVLPICPVEAAPPWILVPPMAPPPQPQTSPEESLSHSPDAEHLSEADPAMPHLGSAPDGLLSPQEAEPAPADPPSPGELELPGLGDPELGILRVRDPLGDPELGVLRIREQAAPPPSPPPAKIAFLTTRVSAVSSDNVLLVENEVGGLTGDRFYRPAASVAIYPSLGPQTLIIGSLDVGLQRYGRQSDLNYSDWQARLALRQGISPRTYAQLSLAYQELRRTGGFRFFDNRSVALSLGRSDPLTPNLTLDSFYQVQWNEAQSRSQATDGRIFTTDFNRLAHTAGAYLGYTPHAQWHTGLSYQINLTDYRTQDRHDTVQQLLGQVVYNLTPRVRLSLYGGRSFGRSSDPRLLFNDTIFGLTLDATVPLF